MADASRSERAESRRKRAILRRTNLGDGEVDLDPIRGDAAVSLVTRLTRESWSLAGFTEPTYTRKQTPCRAVLGHPT